MRVVLLNLGADSLQAAYDALAGQGYEVATENTLTLDRVLALSPEVLVTEATPSNLACCELIAQLKARSETESYLKIVMIVQGDALERARGLDLGAHDVISSPFVPVEFAARVRTQFRERHPQEEVKTKLKFAAQQLVDMAVESLVATIGRRPFRLIPAIFVLCVAAVLAAIYLGISGRVERKETRQLWAEIARLGTGLGQRGEIRSGAAMPLGSFDPPPRSESVIREFAKPQSDDLLQSPVSGSHADSLQHQLAVTQSRLNLLEREGKVAETVVQDYSSSVCLLHIVVEFLGKESGRPLRVIVDATGKPVLDESGMLQLDEEGAGPHLQINAFGTGFLARRDGKVITNHHVVEPWWKNDNLKEILDQGATAYVLSYQAYFPGMTEGLRARPDRISSKEDVATLQLESPVPPNWAVLELDDQTKATVTGAPIVLIGYPTGIESILARESMESAQEIVSGTRDFSRIMAQLALRRLIRPTTTQGHIGDVLEGKIVFDAATTSGGSGGPLFNRDGKVIGINSATLRGFGGSNLAVPSRYAKELLN
jgi:S1-C subfamily serine protease